MKTYLSYIYAHLRQGGLRLLLLAVQVFFVGAIQAQNKTNELYVPDFEGRVDKTVNVPIYLTNTQEVVAVQFDVELPFNAPSDAVATLTNRANQHSVTINAKGGKNFTVIVMSMKNNALRGNSGLLLRLPMQTYDDGNTAKPYPIRLTNIVLTDRQGNNIYTGKGTVTGNYTVSRDDVPDLVVSTITPVTLEALPNAMFSCEFTVKNEGTGSTNAGWTEKVYLESVQTGVRTFIGSMYYSGTLKAGAESTRKFSTYLPSLVHADGQQYVYVELTPDPQTGELIVDQGNNSKRSEQIINLGKKLFASANKLNVSEGWTYRSYYYSSRDYIALTISRSGDWSTDESFPLTSSVSGLLSVNDVVLSATTPQYITIPAKSASATVRIYAVDDNIVRAREADLMIGKSGGYNGEVLHITRTDNDLDPLSLTTSMQQMTEGTHKQLVLTATRGGEMTDALELTVSSNQSQRFIPNPIKISIPKGLSMGSVTLTLIDDDTPQPDVTATFSTWATDYQSASTSVVINDDDRPTLTLTLNPSIVCENAGSQATTAIIRRDRGAEKDGEITVRLNTSSESNVYFADRIVTFAKGEKEKEVKVGVTDNAAVDGQRQYRLTAALYMPTANTTANSNDRAYATAQLVVTDNESPYLTVTSPNNLVGEGSSFKATVTRYVATADNAQTISLSADKASDVKIPATVTIPAGTRSANFTVEVNRNELQDDERMLYINASAQGLATGQLAVRITDRTLPDATCTTPGYDGSQLYSGMPITLTPEICNVGTAILPSDMQIDFFLTSSDHLYSYTKTIPLFTVHTNATIGIAEKKTFQFTGTMPAVVGTYWIYARVNTDGKVSEYSTANNLSVTPAKVNIAAPFSVAELKVEQESYLPGEAVKVSGRVTTKQTEGLKNQYVSITLTGNGQSNKATTSLVDEQTGEFTVYPELSSSANGMVTVKARALGQTEADKTAQINVWSLALTADNTTWTLDENYPKDGYFTIRNNSGKRITGLSIANSALPFGCEMNSLRLSTTTLDAGASTTVSYHVNGTKSMTNSKYSQFTITATSNEGAVAELPIRYYCRATNCLLKFDEKDLNQTLLLNSQRTVQLKVTNHGLKASGQIDMVVPTDLDWLVCKAASPLASVAPGKSDYITFELKHQPGMHSGQNFPAYITLNPATGQSAGARMNVKIVGTEYSKLTVNLEDIFVKACRDYSHVSAAQVSITNARTGQNVMTGLTDGSGKWMTDHITEGTYNVTVSALRHKKVYQQVVIGPGDEKQLTLFVPYQAVLTNFEASQDITDNTYHLVATIDVDQKAPQAIVLPELPDNGFECGSQDFNITLRNVGTFAAQDVSLVFPSMSNATFTIGNIGTIAPGGEVVVPVHYEGPESGRRRSIASILMYYGFSIGGGYYSESDNYQSLVGCVANDQQESTPIVDPTKPDDPSDDDSRNEAQPEGPSTSSALTTLNSSVTLTFDDVTRVNVGEPFYATLHIVNGQNAALRNICFTQTVSDDSDDFETDMTTLFSCEQSEITGFSGQTGQLSLAGQSEGTIKLSFIPTNQVNANGEHIYYIGGQLSYIDPAQNFGQAVMLPQIAITVSQKGMASVVYLLQHDFLGNDDSGEQMMTAVPAQHVMLVRNEGQTNITGFQLQCDEPSVLSNKTNEIIATQMLRASVDTKLTNQQLLDLRKDLLPVGSISIGRWVIQSLEDCHLADVNNLKESVVSKADNELELTVTGVHKLFRAVRNMYTIEEPEDNEAGQQELLLNEFNAADVFLLDDEEDEDHMPDNIMFSNGEETGIQILTNEQITTSGMGGNYTLTVKTDKAGWIYLRMNDLTNGFMSLQKAERAGTVMSQANVWITDHTVLNDYSAVSEYILHLADSVEAGETTYQLTYVTRPGERVHAMNCHLYTANGTEVAAGSTTTERVVKAVVELTGNVKYLYLNSLSIFADDENLDKSVIDILPENGPANVWTLDMSRLAAIPGLHRISFDISKLKEPKPINREGEGTLSVEWYEDITTQVPVTIEVATGEETGSIDKSSGNYNYGTLKLTATPAEGYELYYWEVDGMALDESQTEMAFDLQKATTIRVFFVKKSYDITFTCDDQQGMVSGASSGIYTWQTTLKVTAIPNFGYEFVEWKWNDTSVATQTLEVLVTGDCTYKAVFKEVNTEIIDINCRISNSTNIYGLNGQLLRRQVKDLNEELRSLPEGLYIIGGRKVLNRKK